MAIEGGGRERWEEIKLASSVWYCTGKARQRYVKNSGQRATYYKIRDWATLLAVLRACVSVHTINARRTLTAAAVDRPAATVVVAAATASSSSSSEGVRRRGGWRTFGRSRVLYSSLLLLRRWWWRARARVCLLHYYNVILERRTATDDVSGAGGGDFCAPARPPACAGSVTVGGVCRQRARVCAARRGGPHLLSRANQKVGKQRTAAETVRRHAPRPLLRAAADDDDYDGPARPPPTDYNTTTSTDAHSYYNSTTVR